LKHGHAIGQIEMMPTAIADYLGIASARRRTADELPAALRLQIDNGAAGTSGQHGWGWRDAAGSTAAGTSGRLVSIFQNQRGLAMTRRYFTALAVAGLIVAQPGAAQQTVPVAFAKGKSSAVVTGSITGEQDRTYTVDARAGQTMTVNLKRTKGSPEMNIYAPGNDTAISLGATDPYSVKTVLPTTGRYQVQVYQMRASARRGETASYNLTIAINGAAPRPSTDALVPGTKYNATADIKCVTSVGGKTGACKAGVIRRGNGNATVELKTPDGGQRTITFSNGKATGSDSTNRFVASRTGDDTIVRIGTIEVYTIPDALVFGG
jgi:hypothetical protein